MPPQDGDEISASGEQAVPLALLSQPDDQDQMTTPAVGDAVSLQVDATISRISGGTAFIKATAINGKPLNEAGKDAPTPETDDTEDSLRGEAETMSQPEEA